MPAAERSEARLAAFQKSVAYFGRIENSSVSDSICLRVDENDATRDVANDDGHTSVLDGAKTRTSRAWPGNR